MAATVDIHARVPVALADTLDLVAKLTEKSKSSIIYKAVESYLREAMEDYQDLQDVLERESRPNRQFATSEEVRQFIEENCHD